MTNIPKTHRCKIPQQILANQFQPHFKMIIDHEQAGFILVMKEWLNTDKSISKVQHLKRVKDRNHTTILIDPEKAFVKTPHPFMTKP
jgi:hypothetical protein